MRAAEEFDITLARATIAATLWGDAARPPLLALPGWLDTAAMTAAAVVMFATWGD